MDPGCHSTIALTNLETTDNSPLLDKDVLMHPTRLFNLGSEMLVSYSASAFNIYSFGLTLGYPSVSIHTPIAHDVCEPRIYSFINSSIQLLCFEYPRALDASLDSYPMSIADILHESELWLGLSSAPSYCCP